MPWTFWVPVAIGVVIGSIIAYKIGSKPPDDWNYS